MSLLIAKLDTCTVALASIGYSPGYYLTFWLDEKTFFVSHNSHTVHIQELQKSWYVGSMFSDGIFALCGRSFYDS